MSVYILAGKRTPLGSFMGQLSTVPASRLGAVAIQGAIEKAKVDKKEIEEVFMGQVIQAGAGQAPARQATIFAGLSDAVPATTINKVCGSGLKALISGVQAIEAGDIRLAVAGGMENMSLAPHLLPQSRQGYKFGPTEMKDSMQWDGLWDVYSNRPMGNCAEECVTKYKFTREEQDRFARSSFEKAQEAVRSGIFREEISPVTLQGAKGATIIEEDEGPMKANFEKMPLLKPAFAKDGSITAANASSINDGAAALVLGNEDYKDRAAFKIVSYASFAQDPTWFTTAPTSAMKKCLQKANLSFADIGLFEINEAFAAVVMAAIKDCELDEKKVNVFGGAVALGHPIGCSGARIVVTLMNAMTRKNVRYGMAAVCIGGGEALSMIIEKL